MEGDQTLSGEYTVQQYTDNVLQNCTSETYKMLLSNATPIYLIKKERSYMKCIGKWIVIHMIPINETE